MVTMCHNPTRWAQRAQHPLPPTTSPLHLPLAAIQQRAGAPSSASAAATLSNQSVVPVSAAAGGSLNAEEMHRALPFSSNYGERRPGTSLVTTFVLTRKTLPPPVRPVGHGNPPMRRLSLGPPPPSYRSSSSRPVTATTPTPYRCRLHHQLLRPQSFFS